MQLATLLYIQRCCLLIQLSIDICLWLTIQLINSQSNINNSVSMEATEIGCCCVDSEYMHYHNITYIDVSMHVVSRNQV